MPNDLALWQDWNRGLESFDFKSSSREELNKRDLIGKVITGEHSGVQFRRNFLRCAFRQVRLSDLDWNRVDYKDSVFIEMEVRDSALGSGSTVSCTYSKCRFIRCSFEDAAFHDCFYEGCEFIDCDFKDSMVRNSHIERCIFSDCRTSNKLFDGCRLYENEFRATSLDFRSILDNFGLDSRQLPFSEVREDRTFPSSARLSIEDLLAGFQIADLSPFEIIKLQFYLAGGELIGSDIADKAFKPEAWISLVRAPVNLMRLLQDFSEFIFYLYQSNRLPALFVLKLAILAEVIWKGFRDNPAQLQVSQTASGAYLQCLQWLSDLETVITEWIDESNSEKIIYRTFKEADDESVTDLVASVKGRVPETSVEIRPRNSPVDIVFSNLPVGTAIVLATLFFSTKTRIELSRLKKRTTSRSSEGATPIVSVSIGGAKNETLRNALSVNATLPGTTVFRLDVDYSSALVEKIRKIIKTLV